MVQVFGLYVLPDNECAMLILNCVVGCYETTQNMLYFDYLHAIGNNVFHSKVYMYLYISTDKGIGPLFNIVFRLFGETYI